MLYVRVGNEVTSLCCGLMLLADSFVAYALLAQPGAIFATVVVDDYSSIFGAQF